MEENIVDQPTEIVNEINGFEVIKDPLEFMENDSMSESQNNQDDKQNEFKRNLYNTSRGYGPERIKADDINKDETLQAVKEVENKLKDRVLETINIYSITVSKLPLASKFNANKPWLKITCGLKVFVSSVSTKTDEKGIKFIFLESVESTANGLT